jgi:hypothetical protein
LLTPELVGSEVRRFAANHPAAAIKRYIVRVRAGKTHLDIRIALPDGAKDAIQRVDAMPTTATAPSSSRLNVVHLDHRCSVNG